MKHRVFAYTMVALLCSAAPLLFAQEDAEAEQPANQTPATTPGDSTKGAFWRSNRITGGQITLPFKIRKKPENDAFRMTTDVTLGGFVGLRHHFEGKKDWFLTVPMTGGLTFINLNNGNTALDRSFEDTEVVPGLTWSTGLILQLEQYTLGLMFGKDYASEIGNQWEHHGKLWWSFGIGFSFAH
jgi:hypothetical protein